MIDAQNHSAGPDSNNSEFGDDPIRLERSPDESVLIDPDEKYPTLAGPGATPAHGILFETGLLKVDLRLRRRNAAVGTGGTDAVLSRTFRVIQSAIGALDQIARGDPRRRDGDADARRDMKGGEICLAPLIHLDPLTDTLGDHRRALGGPARHHDRELLATESCAHIEDANRSAQDLGDVAYHHIAGDVAKSIVDALESIEIDHEQRDRCGLANRAVQFFFETRLKVPAIE